MAQNFPFNHFLKVENSDVQSSVVSQVLTKDPLLVDETVTKAYSGQEISGDPQFSLDEMAKINTEILKNLKKTISPEKFSAYFENTFALSKITEEVIEFSSTTSFIKSIIETHYRAQIERIVSDMLGKNFKVFISVTESSKSHSSNKGNILNSISYQRMDTEDPNLRPRNLKDFKFTLDLNPTKDDLLSKVESRYIDHMNPLQNSTVIDTEKTFDNFIVGPANTLAFATAKAVTQNPGRKGKYPSLYFHGGSGLGKTHLLHAIANELSATYPAFAVCLVTARDFMREMIVHIQNRDLPAFQKKYTKTIDILMIDDIHELRGKEGTQNEFFHIFNELHDQGKQLIFTSDKHPKEINGIAERVKTRLQWGLVVDIQRPDLETRIAILKKKAYSLDLFLQEDILTLIASSITDSIRELEGALVRLSAFSDVMKVEIDSEIVKEILALDDFQYFPKSDKKIVTLEQIAKATASYFKISLADLKSRTRNKNITTVRHVAMYLSQKMINATLRDIGLFYGGRDHSSVIHGVEKVKALLKVDTGVLRDISNIEDYL